MPDLVSRARSADGDTRLRAAQELRDSADSWAAGELVRLLADSSGPVRSAARESLRRLGRPATPALLRALDHADEKAACAAADLLGECRPPAAVDKLLIVLQFGPRAVQVAAARALARYDPQARPQVAAVKESATPWVRGRLDEILASPGEQDSSQRDESVPAEYTADGWTGVAATGLTLDQARAADAPPPRLGRWVDSWVFAILLVILVVGIVILVAGVP